MLLAQSASASSSITMIIAYVILFGAIIYFMTIRPQKKQQKAADEMHAGMQAGDSVLTTSGFYGVIIDIMNLVTTVTAESQCRKMLLQQWRSQILQRQKKSSFG